jgi:hypothetical protein
MRSSLFKRSERELITSLVLVALMLRALIPAGFMPGGAGPLSLVLCHDGLPAQFLSHHEHHDQGSSSHFDHCPFGGLASAPVPDSILTVRIAQLANDPAPAFESSPIIVRLVLLPQPRGPPLLS